MARPEPNFTRGELYRLLAIEPEAEDGGGATVTELVEALGCTPKTIRRRLRALKAAGDVELCTKRIRSLADRWTTVPAYRLVNGRGE